MAPDHRAPLPSGLRRFWRDEHATWKVRVYAGVDAFFDLRDRFTALALGKRLQALRRRGVPLDPMEELLLNLYREGAQSGFAAGWNAAWEGKGFWWRLKVAGAVLLGRVPGRRS